ncbi:S1C family serine protease [Demequina muriae]|uniref:Trypsin-like peptidase domain-containing protein n=1 Tax=Demequina muriae TaxID=3051664 RepID=A0ABT8GEY2_9MICO|nr:trypsin-like peptidase domain-containing protein [Demequina sp. EGI L300058]MDN4479980.1 trypsin-like peptidase domain-containing protein [Demequina sp. EGI L300058]
MTDHRFAPPGAPTEQDSDVAAESTTATPPAASQTSDSTAPAAAERSPYAPGADDVMYTSEPVHDDRGYAPPPAAPMPKPPVGRLRKRTVTGVVIGALVIGAGAGFGGAWAYDEWGSSTPTMQLASGEAVERAADSVASVAASVMPSVVSIEASVGGAGESTGSGFVIREDGYVLTNNHVVDGAESVTVILSDGSELDAEVVGATADYDLAVLQVDADGLTPMVFADSSDVVVGDATIAVGSPLGLEGTVTTGIVSALHRPVTAGDANGTAFIDAIQTDAAINPGNSGGPLLNSKGEVIGINSAIAALPNSGGTAGSVGLGFAIPSNQAQRTAEQLIETGVATYPVIGVQLDQRYTGEGVKVVDDEFGVVEGGPAEAAGIEAGDIITAIDGRPITQVDELVVQIRAKAVGDDVTLTVQRGGSAEDIVVTLDSSSAVEYETGEQEPEPED